MRLIGFDPGLRRTGWGVIEARDNHLRHVGDGVVCSDDRLPLADRLLQIHHGLSRVIEAYRPVSAAVEETFVNVNAASTLKLGQARGVALLAPALAGVPVSEYAANLVKKSLVGFGHAGKGQVTAMISALLPGALLETPDAADALAVAICHAHHQATARRWETAS
ncbi:MAG: crossover junction endodeoxyribonuclease RuvC [Alphaproteobacteria bacterium]